MREPSRQNQFKQGTNDERNQTKQTTPIANARTIRATKTITSILLILCLCLQPLQGSGLVVHASNTTANKNASSKPATRTSKEITLSKPTTTKLVLKKGTTYQIKVKDAKKQKITYKSSNKKVATVSSKGKIKAIKKGKTTITISNKYKKKIKFKVIVGTKVSSIKIPTKKTIKVGETYQIKPTIKPAKASVKSVTYVSNKPSIAKVNKKGLVTAIKAGTAKITVTSKDGNNKKAKITITVKENPKQAGKGFNITGNATSLYIGENTKLNATIDGKETKEDITYQADNACISVDKSGNIAALKKGTATVTATRTATQETKTLQLEIQEPVSFQVGDWEYLSTIESYCIEDKVSSLSATLQIAPEKVKAIQFTISNGKQTILEKSLPVKKNLTITDIGWFIASNTAKITITKKDGTTCYQTLDVFNYLVENQETLGLDETDTDGDGLVNYLEDYFGTNKENVDTDGDGLTDYEELFLYGTDPLLADSDKNGITDGMEDADKDGLTLLQEKEYQTDPYNPDTDGDGLSDYDEIFVYETDPLNADTDGDGLSDKEEIDLNLNPKGNTYDGVSDNQVPITQKADTDNEIFDEFIDDESPYELSIEGDFAGSIQTLQVWESPYAAALEGEAVLGCIPAFYYDENRIATNMTLRFHVKETAIPTEETPFAKVGDEFVGINRFQIFTFDEELQMSVPVETMVSEDGTNVYANIDSLGTYFVMDIVKWFEMLGIEAEPEETEEQQSLDKAGISMKSASSMEPVLLDKNELQLLIDEVKANREETPIRSAIISGNDICVTGEGCEGQKQELDMQSISQNTFGNEPLEASGINDETPIEYETKRVGGLTYYLYTQTDSEGVHTYLAIKEALIWKEAKLLCELLGGHLVTIYDDEENRFVNEIANKEMLGNYVALGCTDEEVEGVWKWIAGAEAEKEIPYFNFNRDEPNNGSFLYAYQNHAYMYADGTWDDGVDYVAYPFICEWEGDVPLQSDVKLITNMGIKILPKDFKFPITKTSGDYDKDTLSDWEEVDHSKIVGGSSKIYKSDLPVYIEKVLSKYKNNKNPLKKFAANAYINTQLLNLRYLPIVSDPTSNDGDADTYADNEDENPLCKPAFDAEFTKCPATGGEYSINYEPAMSFDLEAAKKESDSKYNYWNDLRERKPEGWATMHKEEADSITVGKLMKTYAIAYIFATYENHTPVAGNDIYTKPFPDAQGGLLHYLKNTGEDKTINIEGLINNSCNGKELFSGHMDKIKSHARTVLKTGDSKIIINKFPLATHEKKPYSVLNDANWTGLLGDSKGSLVAYVSRNGNKYTIIYRYIVYDYYDWEKNMEVSFVPGLKDSDLYELHIGALARYYYLHGEYIGTEEFYY